ncbi:MAG: penicillin-insensitive murein endopeptidase [Planctomycetota bacterium]
MQFARTASAAAVVFVAGFASLIAVHADESKELPTDPFKALALAFEQRTKVKLPKEFESNVYKLWVLCQKNGLTSTSEDPPKGAIVFFHTPYGGGGRLALSEGAGKVHFLKGAVDIDAIPGFLGWIAGPKKPGDVAPVSTATKPDEPTKPEDPNKPADPNKPDPNKPNDYVDDEPNKPNQNNNNNTTQNPNQSNPNQNNPNQNASNNTGGGSPSGGNTGGGSPSGGNTGGGSPSGGNTGGNSGNTGANGPPSNVNHSPSGSDGTQPGGRKSNKGFIMMPASGDGFYGYYADSKRWGTEKFVYGLERAARTWISGTHQRNVSKMGVGDLSLENGGPISGHSSHQNGVDGDFRMPRKDGANSPVVIGDPNYDMMATQNQMNFIRRECKVTLILFNDSNVGGVRYWPNHANHFHVRVSE